MSTDHDHDDDDRDDAPALPERSVLEAWRVPEPGIDLTDRVLARVEAALPMGGTVAVLPAAPRRKTLGVAVVAVAMAAAATLVLGLAQSWRRTPAAEPAPAAVTAPASPASEPAPASKAPARDEAVPQRPVPAFVPAAPSVPPAGDQATAELTEPGAEPLGADKPPREPDDAKLATLKIGTTQGSAPATVFIDGERIGFTPLKTSKVTPGRHEVRWEWADGTSASLVVEVGAGASLTLKNPTPGAPAPAKPATTPDRSSSPGFDDPFAGRADRPASGGSSPGLKDPFTPAE